MMMGGYAYGEMEPKERCPYCSSLWCADFVDVGIGYIQCGPYHCERCGASEIGPYDEKREISEDEAKSGWYGPKSLPGSSANVDENGNHVRYFEADTNYRLSLNVPPRYDKYGRFIG